MIENERRRIRAISVMARLSLIFAAAMCSAAFSNIAFADGPSPYAARAREVTEHIRQTYFDSRTGVYLKSLKEQKPDYIWLQSVMLSNLVAAARNEPKTYRPLLDKYVTALDGYWDAQVEIPGYEAAPTRGNGNDKYYDDNAWMALALLEAHETTHNPRYLKRADDTLRFVLSGWDDEAGGGIWWHQKHKDGTKNACSNGPAAVGCLRMAKFRSGPSGVQLVAKARKIVEWMNAKLRADDGLFDDRIDVASGQVRRGKLTYSSALMLQANLGLYRATGKSEYLDEAKRIGKAADWFLDAPTRLYRDPPRYSRFMIEADLELYRATKEDYLLERAKRNVDALYDHWKAQAPADMISNASIARVLWLIAENETDAGRAFWRWVEQADK